MLVNVMENVVTSILDLNKKKYPDACFCQKCTDDIKAIALNKLPAKYVSTIKGEAIVRATETLTAQNKTDIDFAIINAMEFVIKNPRH
ncbi:MAG: late competence development ComFB family protein [Oscillospiraceae bacterium]|jgi:competence protein ComFB|nr:late competence development ComFB family protein [Oscillospiraceae bacterium]